MARIADRLQVVVVIRAAFGLRHNVVDAIGLGHVAGTQTDLTQTAVTLEDANARSCPLGSVTACVAVAAMRI